MSTRPFGSTLSVGEFLSVRQAGFRPLAPVIGTSVFHVGWQRPPASRVRKRLQPRRLETGPIMGGRTYFPKGSLTVADYLNEGSFFELEKPTEALNGARQNALGRLRGAARELGAIVVVDVRIQRGAFDFAGGAIEFAAVGTAIGSDTLELEDWEKIPLVTLSGEDFWKLLGGGFWPLGLVGGSSILYVLSGFRTQRTRFALSRLRYQNQEYEDYTNGVYEARRQAMKRLRAEGSELGAAGVLGIEFEHEQREAPRFRRREKDDLLMTGHVLGTAIAPLERGGAQHVSYAVDLRAGG
jgi:uncharacterized protein YbjQ (UPF0145 family)